MKKAFTLVELLIVVVVLVTLMSMVFRLSSIAEVAESRNTTVMRMQRLENCISGYYAAFGSYPPVRLCGSRNIYYKLNAYGIQQTDNDEKEEGVLRWDRVRAACKSQPVQMAFPFPNRRDAYIKDVSDTLMEMYASGEIPHTEENKRFANRISNLKSGWINAETQKDNRWEKCQVFKFGLMSYLLPRFVVMMGHNDNQLYEDFAQWNDNNQIPCRMEDGAPYESWEALNREIIPPMNSDENNQELWKVEVLPSQAVTARWMPNLDGILRSEFPITLYGITVSYHNGLQPNFSVQNYQNAIIYSGGDSQGGENSGDGSTQYVLDCVTCCDGWGHEFYYYSDPPHQSYRLWSSGPNGYTFPPWISEEEIDRDSTLRSNRTLIQNWRADDIVHMSN